MVTQVIKIHPAEAQRRIARMVRELKEERLNPDFDSDSNRVESYWDKAALEFAYETIKEVRKLYADKESSR